jgi:hypothetical protein
VIYFKVKKKIALPVELKYLLTSCKVDLYIYFKVTLVSSSILSHCNTGKCYLNLHKSLILHLYLTETGVNMDTDVMHASWCVISWLTGGQVFQLCHISFIKKCKYTKCSNKKYAYISYIYILNRYNILYVSQHWNSNSFTTTKVLKIYTFIEYYNRVNWVIFQKLKSRSYVPVVPLCFCLFVNQWTQNNNKRS